MSMTTSTGARRAAPAATGPLRVLVGLEGLALGGCPINALDLARTMRDRGHEVNVFAIDESVKVSLLPYADRHRVEVTLLPSRASLLERAAQIHRLAHRMDADVVHVYAPWLGPAAALAAARVPSRAAVVTNWMMENALYTATTPLIVGTAALQREAAARLPARVWLMEPPVDVLSDRPDPALGAEFRRRLGLEAGILLVVVGRVDRHLKEDGLRRAINAVRALDRGDVRLAIVGDGDAFADIRRAADDANAHLGREAVVMVGSMTDPRPAYAAADVVLGMGGSALRGLAHGKPLVVLGEQGFARRFDEETVDYFLDEGFYGLGCPDDPVAHLHSVIVTLLDCDVRRRLGQFGLGHVHDRFSLSAAATALDGIYREAWATRPSGMARLATVGLPVARRAAHVMRRQLRGVLRA